ncbi:MAG TPA: hypothetical protein VGG92_20505 [Caulobacteraceae bacterium]|jgi:hypothetical protein
MTVYDPADQLHRLVKEALDSGAADSLEAAQALFLGFRLNLVLDPGAASSRHHQAALLTAVNLARRVFLGGVTVTGALDVPLAVDMPLGATLGEAVTRLGGRAAASSEPDVPVIRIGGAPRPRGRGFEMRLLWSGWCGGATPAYSDVQLNDESAMPLSPMLAAAMAVSEAYFHVRGGAPTAGRRQVALSLWRPGEADPFAANAGPTLERLPDRLWLLGLGHLGQAYLWTLGLLPYPNPDALQLVLQDMDRITPSTESTSVLSDARLVGEMKTRAMAAWAERRGFSPRIVERYFDDGFQRRDDEPGVVFCGLDNALGRRALDKVGFDLVVEAGLGRGPRDFQSMRIHTLPAPKSADQLWPAAADTGEDFTAQDAYQKLLKDGALDQCGVTLLAGKAVGAPFVGAVAAALAISEVLRHLHDGVMHQVIDLDLAAVGHQQVVLQTTDFSVFNPGYVGIG